MPAVDEVLAIIAAARRRDPLAPVTVIVPSRVAGLQLRRRLAGQHAFANVRFETIARIAELIAAGELARQGRRPLARPIADYAAEQIARQSREPLAAVAGLAGYARALRQTFRRLRRGGFRTGDDVPRLPDAGQLPEISRLYSRFREMTAVFYDEEDLLETAAEVLRASGSAGLPELGDVWVVQPCAQTAAASALLDAVRAVAISYVEIDETAAQPEQRFILAPDPASEARLLMRSVLDDLHAGAAVNEIAVFYSDDRTYRPLLAQAFAAAAVPIAGMPGLPLNELPPGRAVLALARLPLEDYARAVLFDFLSLAPLRDFVPGAGGDVAPRISQWQRLAREAGMTHGLERWRSGLDLFIDDREQALRPDSDISEPRRHLYEADIEGARSLLGFMEALVSRLEPLRQRQSAATFIPAFRSIVEAYLRPGADGLEAILNEVDQLGTIDTIGGQFDLASFAEAFEANLRAAAHRTRSLGDGVLVAGYRLAAGLSFRRVYVCGAYEGALPAVADTEALVQDDVWSRLHQTHPHVEDLNLRLARSREAALRVVSATGDGVLTWSSPQQAANATREYYPAALMTTAAHGRDDSLTTASELKHAPAQDWLKRPPSPLASFLTGRAVDRWEDRLRATVQLRRDGNLPGLTLRPSIDLLRARRGNRFSEYDGNLASLQDLPLLHTGAAISPTSLETYAACGFRYYLGSVLRLRGVDEPEDTDTIGAAERGTLVHKTLERFFRGQHEATPRRPGLNERWTPGDLDEVLRIFEEEFERLRRLGRVGLDVYAGYDRQLIRADLATFLDRDSDFRSETGAVPSAFELRLTPTPAGEVSLTGFVDRIDTTPDGKNAFVIDYKTGSTREFDKATTADPFLGGTKLQLPVYVLAASGAEQVRALYWFISRRGGFEQRTYDESPENRRRFEETVTAILNGVRAGAFPAVSGDEDDYYGSYANCRYCDFDRICSRRRVYELQAKRADAGLAPWDNVGAVARGETP